MVWSWAVTSARLLGRLIEDCVSFIYVEKSACVVLLFLNPWLEPCKFLLLVWSSRLIAVGLCFPFARSDIEEV